MSQTANEIAPTTSGASSPTASSSSAADQPIPIWPEGVLAIAAGITLLLIGLRHRLYLQRKAHELQRLADEFQRQGGLEELGQVAKMAKEFVKGAQG